MVCIRAILVGLAAMPSLGFGAALPLPPDGCRDGPCPPVAADGSWKPVTSVNHAANSTATVAHSHPPSKTSGIIPTSTHHLNSSSTHTLAKRCPWPWCLDPFLILLNRYAGPNCGTSMETTEHDGVQGIFISTHDWDGDLADSECFGDQAFQSLAWQWQSEEFVSLDLFGQCRLHVFDDISCGGKPIYTVDWVNLPGAQTVCHPDVRVPGKQSVALRLECRATTEERAEWMQQPQDVTGPANWWVHLSQADGDGA
ncbi:unnamed protein product [Zymoseptoria tritici ST99CH_3D1]|nr:unnamed protein product [Zymoseptoria tritici ST99CH_3D1]